jgi:hypothetical protein
MNNSPINAFITTVTSIVNLTPPVTPQSVRSVAESCRQLFPPFADAEFEYVINDILAKTQIRIPDGTKLTTPHASWYLTFKQRDENRYWDRYSKYLSNQHTPAHVLMQLDRATDQIVDLFGDPNTLTNWDRRGLVMGDVQSGKTANYIGLTCKAADSGYKVIIILTGVMEDLRRQTQERLDAGFVGKSSTMMLNRQVSINSVGAGLIAPDPTPVVFTSTEKDFDVNTANTGLLQFDQINSSILFVVKKNAKILENLHRWMANNNGKNINEPLLLIDDEADNASINVRDSDYNPTAINAAIRKILLLFCRRTYVGFTATPFANIFINPETENEMLADDLFPKDFIYTLEAPSNYFGPTVVHQNKLIRSSDEAKDIIEVRHKSTHELAQLPESLQTAIDCFFLTNTLRDLRGETAKHRSMLVNISRFVKLHNQCYELVCDYVWQLKQDISNYSKTHNASQNASIHRLRTAYEKEYSTFNSTWEQVLSSLHSSNMDTQVVVINRSSPQRLNYSAHSNGLRVIAVGGTALSRGLTLEGLAISYFHRTSNQYDTLLQMGRWFGYRDGYGEFCRVWMPEETKSYFVLIAEAIEELRKELKFMSSMHETPAKFGIKVRSHPECLAITAAAKMRSGTAQVVQVGYSSTKIETPYFENDKSLINQNTEAFISLLSELSTNCSVRNIQNHVMFEDVERGKIASLLRKLRIHKMNLPFADNVLANFINDTEEGKLQHWDVVVMNGSHQDVVRFGNSTIKLALRTIHNKHGNIKQITSRRRVASGGDDKLGLSEEQHAQAQKLIDEHNVDGGIAYRSVRTKPLIIMHFIRAHESQPTNPEQVQSALQQSSEGVAENAELFSDCVIPALTMIFPQFDDSGSRRVSYVANRVAMSVLEDDADDDE